VFKSTETKSSTQSANLDAFTQVLVKPAFALPKVVEIF
jgi:hypothetical protein